MKTTKQGINIDGYLEVLEVAFESLRGQIQNDTRLKILTYLKSHEKITWTTMQKKMDINSNMIRHHTNYLQKMRLIEKTKPGYKLTNAGKILMRMTDEEIIDVMRKALEERQKVQS